MNFLGMINFNNFFRRTVKHKTNKLLTYWFFQTELVFAKKIRQQQKSITLYMRSFEEQAFRDFLKRFRKQFRKNIKVFLLSSVGFCSFNWEQERINLSSIKHHFDEFDYIQHLQKELYCKKCGKRQAITTSYQIEGVEYCNCENVKICSNKETDSGWKPYLERKNMITWRREERKGLYAYKVYVKYDDISPEDFLFVQTDVEYRKKWDSTAVTLDIVEKDPKAPNSEIIYWEMAWPKLFANRDYVFVRRYFIDRSRKIIVIVNRNTGCQHPQCPVKLKNQRVKEYWSYIVIKSTSGSMDRPGLEFVLTYFDNPGLSIPKTVTTWVATAQMPDFLDKLYNATKIFASMKQEKQEKSELSFWDEYEDPGYEYPPDHNFFQPGEFADEAAERPLEKIVISSKEQCEDEDDFDEIPIETSKKRTSWWSYFHPYSYFV